MRSRTNIETQLLKTREKRITSEAVIAEIQLINKKNEGDCSIASENTIQDSVDDPVKTNDFDLDLISSDRIFHLQDIKKLCVDYRLRFLAANFFKGEIPMEAISEVKRLEKQHKNTIEGLKIMAPSKLLKLENADDPLLFAPLGNDYFYLIHKWGKDLHPFRKLLMWPYKSFENLVFTVFLVSILLTLIAPLGLFTQAPAQQEYLLTFLFIFKAVGGFVLFYGFAKGKNFNTAIWDSPYYNA